MPTTTPDYVIFRRWPASEGGRVDALFPLIPGTREIGNCTVFSLAEGHGCGDLQGVIEQTAPAAADSADVIALAAALRRIGYDMAPRTRAPSRSRVARAHRAGAGV